MEIGHIRDDLLKQVEMIDPLPGWPGGPLSRACRVFLRDGDVLDRVILTEVPAELPVDDPLADCEAVDSLSTESGRSVLLSIDDIERIGPSPCQTPAPVYEKLMLAGETGMGYQLFEIELNDGRRLRCFSEGQFAFLDLPGGVTPDMIVDADPLPREAAGASFECMDAESHWCFYLLPEE